jgi:hypothetical protein
MTIYPAEFHRRCQERWERRAASRLYESARRMPWLLAIGRTLRTELDAVEQPVSERLTALLKELDCHLVPSDSGTRTLVTFEKKAPTSGPVSVSCLSFNLSRNGALYA